MGSVFRELRVRDFPGEQHAAGLASDSPAPNHAVPEPEIVFGLKILPEHLLQLFILRHGAFQDQILRLPAEPSLPVLFLCHGKETVVTVIILILLPGFLSFEDLVIAA